MNGQGNPVEVLDGNPDEIHDALFYAAKDEATVITANGDWNNAYYGRVVSPVDIAIRGNVRGPAPTGLANELDRATARRTSSAQ